MKFDKFIKNIFFKIFNENCQNQVIRFLSSRGTLFDDYQVSIDLSELNLSGDLNYQLEVGVVSQGLNSPALLELTASLNGADYELGREKKVELGGENYFILSEYPNYDHFEKMPLLPNGNGTLTLQIKRNSVIEKRDLGLWAQFGSSDFYGINSPEEFDFAQVHLGIIKVDTFGIPEFELSISDFILILSLGIIRSRSDANFCTFLSDSLLCIL